MAGKPRGGKRKMWKRRPARKAKRTVLVNRALAPIPQRYITKQKYSTAVTLSALVSQWQFNLNSVYDPDRTGVGHQPYGFDQLSALYNRYRVISTSWVVNAYNNSNAIRVATIVGNDAALPVSMSDIVERPRAKFIVQNPGGNTQYLKGKAYMPSVVGRNKAQYMADDRYQATTSSDPNELVLLQVLASALTDGNVDGTALVITLEYTVEYFDVKPLAQS